VGAGSRISTIITLPHITPRRLLAGALATAAVAAVATPALAAQTSPRTLRFYESPTAITLTDASGKAKDITAGAPAAGDTLDVAGKLYVGTHRHHGRRVVGTDHTRCTFTAPDAGTCQGEVAMGGSLILVRSALTDDGFTVWYGTGRFAGATGTGTTTTVSEQRNDSDVVVHLK
jgi:hypothetical protein